MRLSWQVITYYYLGMRTFTEKVNITRRKGDTFWIGFRFSSFHTVNKQIIQSQLSLGTYVTSSRQQQQQWLTSSSPVPLSTNHDWTNQMPMISETTYVQVAPISWTTHRSVLLDEALNCPIWSYLQFAPIFFVSFIRFTSGVSRPQ